MSTRIEHLLKALRDLPYEDMVKLAAALSEELKGVHSAHFLADALLGLRSKFVDIPAEESREEKALREMVGTRRRGFTLKVGRQPKGWTAYIEEFSAQSVAQDPEARIAIARSLDQAITSHIMMK